MSHGRNKLLKINSIYPTQLAIGLREVDKRKRRMKRLSSKELRKHLEKNPVPIVIGPKKRAYLIDHHHLVRACLELGITQVFVEKHKDMSHLSPAEFWKEMEKEHWVHLYDEFGHGPHSPVDLPQTVRSLGDDPFRSIAWEIRERGGYIKTDMPFAEFAWANFFRRSLGMHPVADDWKEALQAAERLCRSTRAKSLPGYKKK